MKINTALLLSIFVLASLPAAIAGGLGVSPSIMTLDELARGNVYEKNLKILNTEGGDITITISPTGEAAEWIKVYDPDTSELLETSDIEGGTDKSYRIEFDLPVDAPNGEYEGFFDVQPQGDTQVSVIVRGFYSFTITGEEVKDGVVDSVVASDTESGQALRIRYDFRNTGNVAVAPEARVKILQDGTEVDSFTATGTVVSAGQQEIQFVEWDTENRGTGDFAAEVEILTGDTIVSEQDLTFALAPRGTFTLDAIIGDLKRPDEFVMDEIARLSIQIFNVGKIDFNAKAVVEVFDGDKLVDVVESTEIKVIATKQEELLLYFTPEKGGEYTFKPVVTYGGETEVLDELEVRVQSTEEAQVNTDTTIVDNTQPAGPSWLVIGGGLIVLLLIAVVVLLVIVIKKK